MSEMHGENQRHGHWGTTQAGGAELKSGCTGLGRRIQLGVTGRLDDSGTIGYNMTVRRDKQPKEHVALYFLLIE